MQYILEQGVCHGTVFNSCHTSFAAEKNPLTEIQEGELYLCLEHRTVRVRERIINLTSKEFDILALLIANPKRVFTYELITDLVWKEDCDFYSRKAMHNHISKLRKKLRFQPDLPNYIESVAGIGYKFEHLQTKATRFSCGFNFLTSTFKHLILKVVLFELKNYNRFYGGAIWNI